MRIRPSPLIRLKRFRRKVRQREKAHRARGGRQSWPAARSRRPVLLTRIPAPALISIQHSEHRRGTLQFCSRLRRAYLHDGSDLILDFSRTDRVDAPGMLIVVAEVDRALRMGSSDQKIRVKLPDGDQKEAQIVREVLEQVGLLHRLGYPTAGHGDENFDETVRHWRYATGTRVDTKPGDVLERHEGRIAPALMTSMQIGLTEALLNSLHHAYKAERDDGCGPVRERRWWMFTREMNGRLEVLVCDLGIGIPRSLPLTWERNVLKRLQSLFSDDHPDIAAIKLALLLGQTSTGDEHRGKGLPQIWNATQNTENSFVGILSGHAYLSYDSATSVEKSGSFHSTLLGTLITWVVPIDSNGGKNG